MALLFAPDPMQLKRTDSRLVLGLVLLFIVVTVAVWWLVGPSVALLVGLGLALLLILGMQLHLYRVGQAEAEQRLRHVQALLSLFSLNEYRAPLPPLTGWAASAELAATVYALVRAERPERVVELGSGASTLVIAYALEQNGRGRVTSLDHDETYAASTARTLERHGLTAWGRVLHAPLVDVRLEGERWPWYDLSRLPDEGPIDLLVIDGPPKELRAMARYPAVPLLFDRLSPTAVVVLDDAYRKDERKAVARWREALGPFDLEVVPSPKGTAVLRRV